MEYQHHDVQVLDHAGVDVQEVRVRSRHLAGSLAAGPPLTRPSVHSHADVLLGFLDVILDLRGYVEPQLLGHGQGHHRRPHKVRLFPAWERGIQAHAGVTEA